MKTTVGPLHLDIRVGVWASERYPIDYSKVFETRFNNCLFYFYIHIRQLRCSF